MSKFDDLNDTFNVESEVVEVKVEEKSIEKPQDQIQKDQILKDYEYTRGNLYSLIEKGQEAVNGILELAQETEMPRAYEVAGQLIKNVSDATDKLLDLQKKMHDLEKETKSLSGPTTVNNALFIGSTAELSKLLNKNDFNKDNI
jgi:hypothetical protein